MSNFLLRIENLVKIYNSGTASEVVAVNDVSLRISNGDFIILLGSNGSGKSSLLQLIAGSIKADSGKIILDNVDVTSLPEHKRSKWVSRVFQDPLAGTAAGLSVLDNCRIASLRTQSKKLHIGVDRNFRDNMRERLSELGMGLENKPDLIAGNLSGGQRQALTLLMAVLDNSKLLLMDEPASALDPKSAARLMELTGTIAKKYQLTVMLVTHNLKDATIYGNRLIMMKEGKIIQDLDKKQSTPGITELFEMF